MYLLGIGRAAMIGPEGGGGGGPTATSSSPTFNRLAPAAMVTAQPAFTPGTNVVSVPGVPGSTSAPGSQPPPDGLPAQDTPPGVTISPTPEVPIIDYVPTRRTVSFGKLLLALGALAVGGATVGLVVRNRRKAA